MTVRGNERNIKLINCARTSTTQRTNPVVQNIPSDFNARKQQSREIATRHT